MIQVTLEELRQGHVLAKTVYRPTGEIILSVGFHMTDEVRSKLGELGQGLFWVQEPGMEEILPEELIAEATLHHCADEMRQTCQALRKGLGFNDADPEAKVPDPWRLLEEPGKIRENFQIKRLKQIVRILFQELRKISHPLLHLSSSRTQANWMFQHAVDCCLISGVIARRFALTDAETEDLMLGTLAMDIGFQILPDRLSGKSGRLSFSEFSLVKEHPNFGYEMLRSDSTIPLVCAHVALQHHERQDGGGYPRRLLGRNLPPVKQGPAEKNSIHRFAEIAAVADEFLNLIKPKPGNDAKTPLESIRFLLRASGSRLNSSIVDALIPLIPLYTSGSRVVVVQDAMPERIGCVGVVCRSNSIRQDRPEIILIYDRNGQRMKPFRLSLEESGSTVIQEILPGRSPTTWLSGD